MKTLLSRFSLKNLWNNQFLKFEKRDLKILTAVMFIVGLAYVIFEVLLMGIPDGSKLTSLNLFSYNQPTLIN